MFSDFLETRRVVSIPEMGTADIGPATVGAVMDFLRRSGELVAGLVKTFLKRGEKPDRETLIQMFSGPAISYPLARCIHSKDHSTPEIADFLLRARGEDRGRLISACLELTDIWSCYEFLGLEEIISRLDRETEPPKREEGNPVTDQDIALCWAAVRFGISPMEIMNWPMETWAKVSATLPLLKTESSAVSRDEGRIPSAGELAFRGIPVSVPDGWGDGE